MRQSVDLNLIVAQHVVQNSGHCIQNILDESFVPLQGIALSSDPNYKVGPSPQYDNVCVLKIHLDNVLKRLDSFISCKSTRFQAKEL